MIEPLSQEVLDTSGSEDLLVSVTNSLDIGSEHLSLSKGLPEMVAELEDCPEDPRYP